MTECPEDKWEFAGFWRRAAALTVDLILIGILTEALSAIPWIVAADQFRKPFVPLTTVITAQHMSTEREDSGHYRLRYNVKEEYSQSGTSLGICHYEFQMISTDNEANPSNLPRSGPPQFGALFEMPEYCEGNLRADIGGVFGIAIWLFFAPFFESRQRQATPGKIALSLRVVRQDNFGTLSFPRAFMRNISELLCLFTLSVGYLTVLFTKNKQALHDLVSGSVVYKC